MKRYFIAATVCSAFVLMTVGCGDKSNPTGPTSTNIVGKWVFSKETTHGTATVMGISGPYDTTTNYSGSNNFLDIKGDNTYIRSSDQVFHHAAVKTESGKWSLSGNSLTTIATSPADTTVYAVSINGNSGTFAENINISIPLLQMSIVGTTTYTATKQ